jgi:hypothetical protein
MFQTTDCKGNPVTRLKGDDFIVRESPDDREGRAVSKYESQQVILPRRVGSQIFFLLLLDMSGSVQKAPGGIASLQGGARVLTRSLIRNQSIALAVFDGSEEIHLLQDYTREEGVLNQAIDRLATWQSRDSSTNLYGAYIKGLEHLRDRMKKHQDKFAQGFLAILTDGTDQANRRNFTEASRFRQGLGAGTSSQKLDQTRRFMVATISVGGEVDRNVLCRLADPRMCFSYEDWKQLSNEEIVGELARRLDELGRSFHVLSYCSPKRRGAHKVQVEVDRERLGTGGDSNRIAAPFVADGFTGGCDADSAVAGVAECGKEYGKSCDSGFTCDEAEFRCISDAEQAKERRRRADSLRALEAERDRRQAVIDSGYRACRVGNDALRGEWSRHEALYKQYLQGDCGFRLRLEGAVRLYPAPDGVAGALVVGWSFPRWVELHAGLGFYPVVFLTELRVKPWSWRWLDLIVTPRIAVGMTKAPWTLEADLLVGLRARMGRYFAMYLQLGPGYAQSSWGPSDKKSFVLPGWLGAEARF